MDKILRVRTTSESVPRVSKRRTHRSAACLRARYCTGVPMLLGLIYLAIARGTDSSTRVEKFYLCGWNPGV